jgi:Ser/Thr protein kinase RdoA (MazF antagonist)
MAFIDFTEIVKQAWKDYDETREIIRIVEISAKVSTNYVYRITFKDESFIIAKLSYFGKFEHFVEDHTIVNALSNNLPAPFENFLARSLMKGNSLYVYRFQNELLDAWVVFYRPIEIKKRLPKRLSDEEIVKLGKQLALFHKACYNTRNTLPSSSKTLKTDIDQLLRELETDYGKYEHRMNRYEIRKQADAFFEGSEKLGAAQFDKIPVFMDWNIGNFSVTEDFNLFSRWDYDWFRVSTRMMDFYFLSRVVSEVGDKTVFSYQIGPLMEDRFILFLKAYHAEYPLTKEEILFMKEAYRFFILNYVIKDGRHFFHEIFATKLMREAYDTYFPSIEKEFNADKILKALDL